MSKVLRVPAAGQDQAMAHFAARLTVETDVSDVAADLGEGVSGLVVVDSRSQESWDQAAWPARSICRPTRSPTARPR